MVGSCCGSRYYRRMGLDVRRLTDSMGGALAMLPATWIPAPSGSFRGSASLRGGGALLAVAHKQLTQLTICVLVSLITSARATRIPEKSMEITQCHESPGFSAASHSW